MENSIEPTQKNKTKKVILFGLGTLALGGLTFLGIKLFTKPKTTTNDEDLEKNSELDTKTNYQNNPKSLVHSPVPPVYVAPSFPLKVGARGDNILRLQRALIKSYGSIAKAIYDAIIAKDYTSSITLLKGIKSTTDYSLVSEQLKTYRINGVRQTLVNAMLNAFTESSQKLGIQEVFKSMGLKYDGTKWSL
jgi:hypothetical protein